MDGPATIGGGAGAINLGAGISLAPGEFGLQIDSIIPSADVIAIASGAPTGVRITVLQGQPQLLLGLSQNVPQLFARYYNAVGSDVGERHKSAIDVFTAQRVVLDFIQMSVLFPPAQKPLIFSSRPGGGLMIPPGVGALVLATFYLGDDAAPGNTQPPYVGLTVCGSALTRAQAGGDVERTPGRFNNVSVNGAR